MGEWRWVSGGLGVVMVAWLCARAPTPASPIVSGAGLGQDFDALEARVSRHPEDATALARLVQAYLAHAAPGLAEAALERAPAELRDQPRIADARARTLTELGFSRQALAVQLEVLLQCQHRSCPSALEGHAEYRADYLAELVKLDVDDPQANPALAKVAYRRSTREVALDIP